MNGNTLLGKLIPDEILQAIFLFIPEKNLIKTVPLVCQHWHQLSRSCQLWLSKLGVSGVNVTEQRKLFIIDHWGNKDVVEALQGICLYSHLKGFHHNLIKNPSGRDAFNFWNITHGGDGVAIESSPAGSDPIPSEANVETQHCFATSYSRCSRLQIIHLTDYGITPTILKVLKPTIKASEWVSARFDCGSVSRIELIVGNERDRVLQSRDWRDSDYGRVEWHKIQLDLEWGDYPPNATKITFVSSGKDTQFWAGHYGAKSAASSVILQI